MELPKEGEKEVSSITCWLGARWRVKFAIDKGWLQFLHFDFSFLQFMRQLPLKFKLLLPWNSHLRVDSSLIPCKNLLKKQTFWPGGTSWAVGAAHVWKKIFPPLIFFLDFFTFLLYTVLYNVTVQMRAKQMRIDLSAKLFFLLLVSKKDPLKRSQKNQKNRFKKIKKLCMAGYSFSGMSIQGSHGGRHEIIRKMCDAISSGVTNRFYNSYTPRIWIRCQIT